MRSSAAAVALVAVCFACACVRAGCGDDDDDCLWTAWKKDNERHYTSDQAAVAAMMPLLALSLEPCNPTPTSLCYDATCGQTYDVPDPIPCTEKDIGYTFMPCDPDSRTRRVVYYWKPPATCRLGVPLPAQITGVPCDKECSVGKFLNSTDFNCYSCKPGGGRLWDTWTEWPAGVTTTCSTTNSMKKSCSGWRLLGTSIDSGSNNGIHAILSALKFSARFSRNGSITFTYRTSTEKNWDVFRFRVDDNAVLVDSGIQTEATTVTFKLAAGFHTMAWEYQKDVSFEKGEDRVQITSIIIENMTVAVLGCSLCPAGREQKEAGQGKCTLCPANYYAKDAGTASCLPCPKGQVSIPGAARCFVSRNCSQFDVAESLSSCTGGKRQKTFSWIAPAACDTARSTLPAAQSLNCDSSMCHQGQILAEDGTCAYCADGTHSDAARTACSRCGAASQPKPRVEFVGSWGGAVLPTGFSTGCTGECTSHGWRSGGSFVDSGAFHGPGTDSWLTTSVEVERSGSVSFVFEATCPLGAGSLVFQVDSATRLTLPCAGCAATPTQSIKIDLEAGSRQLTWSYRTNATEPDRTSACSSFRVRSVEVVGVTQGNGGSDDCEPCPAGKYGKVAGECTACPAGHSSSEGAEQCTACHEDTFAKQGSAKCLACGTGTRSLPGSGSCSFNCSHVPLSSFYADNSSVTFSLAWAPANSRPEKIDNTRGVLSVAVTACSSLVVVNATADPDENVTYTGDMISFLPNGVNVKDGFNVVYMSSDSGKCVGDVKFVCDPVEKSAGGSLTLGEFSDSCIVSLVWRSRSACRKCTAADYRTREGDCIKNKMNVSYYWTTDMCYGGEALPATRVAECVTPEHPASASYKKWALIGTFIAVTVVVIGAAIAVTLVRHNRRIYARYKKLANETQLDSSY
eukprot:m51a1_g2079 hypothetical protein (911) ;mRNA; r:1495974-1501279